MPIKLPNLDDRRYTDLMEEMRALIPLYAPQWTDHNPSDPGITLLELFAWLTEALIYRVNRVPPASRERFLALLGAVVRPAIPATVTLTVTADQLDTVLTIPPGTPLKAQRRGDTEALAFETIQPVVLTPSTCQGIVIARQAARVQQEYLGVSNGRPHQSYPLQQAFLLLDPDGPFPAVPSVMVDAEPWEFTPTLSASPDAKLFTVDIRANAIRFGDGDQTVAIQPTTRKARLLGGKSPAPGVPITVSYRYTLGEQGNLVKGEYDVDVAHAQLCSAVKEVANKLSFCAITPAAGGLNPPTLDDLQNRLLNDLRTPWRAVTTADFEQLAQNQADVAIDRAQCLPESDLERSTVNHPSQGHISLVVVPKESSCPLINTPGTLIAFSPDGLHSVLVDEKQQLHIAHIQRPESTTPLPGFARVDKVTFSHDGCWLAVAHDKWVSICATWRGEPVATLAPAAGVRETAFMPNGQWLLATVGDDNQLRLWRAKFLFTLGAEFAGDLARNQLSAAFRQQFRFRRMTLPDACYITTEEQQRLWRIVCGPTIYYVSKQGETFAVYDTGIWDLLATLPHPSPIQALRFSPDGRRLVTVCGDNLVRRWDTWRGDALPGFVHPQQVTDAIFSPDGKRLATISVDHTCRVWDALHNTLLATFIQQTRITHVAFSPDGRAVATAGDDQIVRWWNVETEHVLPEQETPCNPAAVSENLQWSITVDNQAQAYFVTDTRSGKVVATLFPHAPVDTAPLFSADGKQVITANNDGIVQLWDLPSGREQAFLNLQQLGKKLYGAHPISFCPTGKYLATLCYDAEAPCTVLLWKIDATSRTWSLLDERRLLTCQHHVVGPAYTDVRIETTVICTTLAEEQTVRKRILEQLQAFFDPRRGGSAQGGWPFGRSVYASEIYHRLEGITAVDHVESLRLQTRTTAGDWQTEGNEIRLPADHLVHFVVADASDITVRAL